MYDEERENEFLLQAFNEAYALFDAKAPIYSKEFVEFMGTLNGKQQGIVMAIILKSFHVGTATGTIYSCISASALEERVINSQKEK